MKKKNEFLLILLFLVHVAVFSQSTITVTGVVSEVSGQPLPGATVVVQGTSIGTQTDFDGNYTLDSVPTDGILVFSYIGYAPQEIPVNNQTIINASLQEDTQRLDEVVVVGYGEQKRSDITGAVVSVKSEEIVKIPALTAVQSIQGKVAGVNIVVSDAPGATPTVQVRGLGTALGGRDPFYVVDGQPLQDIRSINPADIESIEFLKGASYANIYGIRAANGVILVTTKKGKEGKIQFNFDSFFGMRSVLNRVEMANGEQYRQYFNEENAAINGPQLVPNQRYDTDWYDELLQTGTVQSHNFSVSGASERVNYFLSYNFYDEEGILEDSRFTRGNIRSNNTFRLFDDKVRIIQNLNLTYTNENPKSFGAFNTAFRQSPLVPVRYDNGRFGQSFYNQTTGVVGFEAADGESISQLNNAGNPVAEVFFDDVNQSTTTLQGQITLEADITDYLTATGRFGATQGFLKRNEFTPTRQQWLNANPIRTVEQFEFERSDPDGDGVISTVFANNEFVTRDEEFYRWNLEGFLTFDRSFGKHNVSATVGLSRENFGGREILEAQGFDVFDEPRLRNLNLRTSAFFDNTVTQEFNQSTNLQSYFARAEYDFAEKYFLRAVIRRDGTSDFITGENFFDNFPAFSAGWTLTEEDFLKENEVLNFLKVFGGWGQLGNANVPINVQQINTNPESENQNYVFGPTQELIFGASFGSPTFPLQWEVTEEWEAGFDFAMLDRKLSGTFTYYNRNNTNAIINVLPILNSVAEDDFNAQAAEVSNVGFEGLVNWRDRIGEDFTYNIGINFSTNRNRVENVVQAFDGQVGGSLANGQITKRLEEGQPLFAWWLWEADGVWQTQEEIDNNPSVGNARPGHLRYVDQNEDGVIDDRDKRYFGNYLPTFNYGISIGAQYKNFDFSLDGFGVGGNKVYNALANTRLQSVNISEEVFNNRWTGPGSTNSSPGADRDALASSFWLEDGDFFRINNITLGYTFNQMGFLDRARLYFTAQNPFMFTNYSGFTPELNRSGTDQAGNPTFGDPRFGTGIELDAYPTTRTFILGLNLQI